MLIHFYPTAWSYVLKLHFIIDVSAHGKAQIIFTDKLNPAPDVPANQRRDLRHVELNCMPFTT